MPNMRVHELAKEFGMTSQELLEHLARLKIPVKGHSSSLVEAYVGKIRKDLAPIIAERQAELQAARLVELEEERKAAEALEEQIRAEAAERARRESDARAKREAKEAAAKAAKEAEETRARIIQEANAAALAAQTEQDAVTTLEKEEEERYRAMAAQAEAQSAHKIAHDRVIEEARIAVAMAHAQDGKRKKRKKKRDEEAVQSTDAQAAKSIQTQNVAADSVTVTEGATVAEFADALGLPANEIIKRLMILGTMLTVNQPISRDIMELIADDLGVSLTVLTLTGDVSVTFDDNPEDLVPRLPVVTVMGHVDHGKTSLLDAIRNSGVAQTEAGGITQHIGASVVKHGTDKITFIDTPGHETFTAMRARGAKVTDIAVLVVAADDGVMPQTIEAIHHAQAAGVPIIVAVNKIDKEGADPQQVRQMLTEHAIVPEEWGGKNIFVNVSAKNRTNIDELLETILLVAEVEELKANPNALASGVVIEAKLDKGRGPVATVLIQRGTLKVGDPLVAGTSYGRIRALIDPRGRALTQAVPGEPAEILGLGSAPSAGDEFRVFTDERDARDVAEERALKQRLLAQDKKERVSLNDLFSRIQEGDIKDLNLVVKADAHGSIEALKDALDKMDQSEVRIAVIHSAVGGITETDVMLAEASDAIVIGFNVRPEPKAKVLAEKSNVDLRLYRVIYQAIEDINSARIGMLSPQFAEEDTARVEIREIYRVPKIGVIAGCYVLEGEINRDDQIRIVRQGAVIFEGKVGSLRRFKDDVKSVRSGYECGISIEGYQDIKIGDFIEAYKTIEIARNE